MSANPKRSVFVPYVKLSKKYIAQRLSKNLPAELKQLRIFLMFRFMPPRKPGGKAGKVPFYAEDGMIRKGEQGTPKDRARLVEFDEAIGELSSSEREWNGIGAAALGDNPLFFVDLDHCVDPWANEISDVAKELMGWGTYTEISPSSKGLRLIFQGRWSSPRVKNHTVGIEVFSDKGFVTLTGAMWAQQKPKPALPIKPSQIMRLRQLLAATPALPNDYDPLDVTPSFTKPAKEKRELRNIPAPLTKERFRDAREALKYIDPDCSYQDWVTIGQALQSGSPRLDGNGFKLWVRWSQRGDKFQQTSVAKMMQKWQSFRGGRGVTMSSLFGMAKDSGYDGTRKLAPDELEKSVINLPALSTREVVTRERFPLVEGMFDDHGAYLFIGRAKIGKSRVLGALVAGAVSGGSALGFRFKKKSKVLAITLEEDPDTMLDRVRLYMVDPIEYDRKIMIISEPEVEAAAEAMRDDYDWAEYVDALLKKYKPDFVYLDTAVKLRMMWQNDPGDARKLTVTEQDYQNVSWLDKAARKHGCVLVATIHGSKRKASQQGDFDPFDSIGTTSWSLAGCTGAIVLMDKPGRNALEGEDPHRLLCLRGRYMAKGDRYYQLEDRQDGTFVNLGEYHMVQASVRTQQFLETIAQAHRDGAEYVIGRTIAAECGCHQMTVRGHLAKFMASDQLYEGRRLEAVQSRGYRLVEDGARGTRNRSPRPTVNSAE